MTKKKDKPVEQDGSFNPDFFPEYQVGELVWCVIGNQNYILAQVSRIEITSAVEYDFNEKGIFDGKTVESKHIYVSILNQEMELYKNNLYPICKTEQPKEFFYSNDFITTTLKGSKTNKATLSMIKVGAIKI